MKSSLILVGSLIGGVVLIIVAFYLFRPTETVTLPLSVQEYADFDCPHCRDFEPTAEKIRKDFGSQINFQVISNPILGQGSLIAAYAAEAANQQGKYLPYVEALYANFDKRNDTDFSDFATKLGLDITKFNNDRNNPSLQKKVNDQLQQNTDNGITSTPTIYINGKVALNVDYDSLHQLIMDKIALGQKQAQK